jgi:hypothetical protein
LARLDLGYVAQSNDSLRAAFGRAPNLVTEVTVIGSPHWEVMIDA